MTEPICATPNCFTYLLPRAVAMGSRYCLACELDKKMPQPAPPNERGRPMLIVQHILNCDLSIEECEECERALMMVPDDIAQRRLNQVWALLEEKREGRR